MLNDPAPAISWSVVDWRRRPKTAYETLRATMSPVLICAQYPKESNRVGSEVSLPLFVVNDFSRSLGRLGWSWELYLEGTEVARGSGWTQIPADSVVRIGRTAAVLPAPGHATLRLSLFVGSSEAGAEQASNGYEFEVKGGPRPRRGT